MFRSRKQTPVSENKYRNPWITLSIDEKRKCHEKFEQYKPSGSTIITKHELQKMLKEIGRDASEEELLEMLQRGDPKGEGFISY
jgi:Ca2+-binding EF-hand superfamily protein